MAHRIGSAGRAGRSSVSGSKAVVFGAYGFIGRYVVQRLARQGTQVVIPHRCDPYDVRHLRPTGDLGVIRSVYFDPKNDNDLDLVTRGVDAVYNLMGQELATSNWSLKDVHVDLASRLAAAAQQNGVGRFIQMSSVGADKASTSDFYATKAEGEEGVLENFPLATIMRSARVFGPEDRYSNRIASMYQRVPEWLPIPIPNGGASMRAPIYVGDLAQALVEVMTHKHSKGQIYELFGPEMCSQREFIAMVSEVILRDHTVGYIPYNVLRTAGHACHLPTQYLLKSSALHKDVIDQDMIDEIPSTFQGLGELDVTATPFSAVALRWLRRFRPPHYVSQVISDAKYKATGK